MKQGISISKFLGLFLTLALMTVGTVSYASPQWERAHDPEVNTWVENRFDHNNNGWIGPRERAHIHHHKFVKHHALCENHWRAWNHHYWQPYRTAYNWH